MSAHFAFCGGNVFQPVQGPENRSWRLAIAHTTISSPLPYAGIASSCSTACLIAVRASP